MLRGLSQIVALLQQQLLRIKVRQVTLKTISSEVVFLRLELGLKLRIGYD